MSAISDSSDGFEIVDIINKHPDSSTAKKTKSADEINESINENFNLQSNSRHNTNKSGRNVANISLKRRKLCESSIIDDENASDFSLELRPKRKLNGENDSNDSNNNNNDDVLSAGDLVSAKPQKSKPGLPKTESIVLLSSSDHEKVEYSLLKTSHNNSELVILEENVTNQRSLKVADAMNTIEAFFNDTDSFDEKEQSDYLNSGDKNSIVEDSKIEQLNPEHYRKNINVHCEKEMPHQLSSEDDNSIVENSEKEMSHHLTSQEDESSIVEDAEKEMSHHSTSEDYKSNIVQYSEKEMSDHLNSADYKSNIVHNSEKDMPDYLNPEHQRININATSEKEQFNNSASEDYRNNIAQDSEKNLFLNSSESGSNANSSFKSSNIAAATKTTESHKTMNLNIETDESFFSSVGEIEWQEHRKLSPKHSDTAVQTTDSKSKRNERDILPVLSSQPVHISSNHNSYFGDDSFLAKDCAGNRSFSLQAIDDQSEDEQHEIVCADSLSERKESDWVIKQHPKYLATVSLTSDDLDRQLKVLNFNKFNKQKYAFANKVKKSFKTDIVNQELLLTTNLDIPLKNDDPSVFYLPNNDLLIKKGDSRTLKRSISELLDSVGELKYATFTRRLTSVFDLNSGIYLPISLLLETGNSPDRTTKLNFVDVDMVECLLLLDCQNFYEILSFEENKTKKESLENFFKSNKRILLVLTNKSKFLSNLKKWENAKQMAKFQDINSGASSTKKRKNKIPEQFTNLTAADVQSFLLQIQLIYKTHISIHLIETELSFINDWFFNYLKTVLRNRYSDPNEESDMLHSLNITSTVPGSLSPFDTFLLGLNGVSKNNIAEISDFLGSDFNKMQQIVDGLLSRNDCTGTKKKILGLMGKFLRSDNGADIL